MVPLGTMGPPRLSPRLLADQCNTPGRPRRKSGDTKDPQREASLAQGPGRVHDHFQRNRVGAHAGAARTCHPQVALYTLNGGRLGRQDLDESRCKAPSIRAGMIRVPFSRHVPRRDPPCDGPSSYPLNGRRPCETVTRVATSRLRIIVTDALVFARQPAISAVGVLVRLAVTVLPMDAVTTNPMASHCLASRCSPSRSMASREATAGSRLTITP